MDNFRLSVVAEGTASLRAVIQLAMVHNNGEVTSYGITEEKGLVFLKYPDSKVSGVVNLPFKLDAAGAADFAQRWLDTTTYPNEPDHDGDNGRGWHAYTEDWGHIRPYGYMALIGILPVWACYGK